MVSGSLKRQKSNFDPEKVSLVLRGIFELILENPFRLNYLEISPNRFIFDIYVQDGDYGRALGKKGRTISAIREIVKTISGTFDKEIILTVRNEVKNKGA